MARERTGFIVSHVCATVEYTDANGQRHKISKAVPARTAKSKTNRLNDAEKQSLKLNHAKQIIRQTIRGAEEAGRVEIQRRD